MNNRYMIYEVNINDSFTIYCSLTFVNYYIFEQYFSIKKLKKMEELLLS